MLYFFYPIREGLRKKHGSRNEHATETVMARPFAIIHRLVLGWSFLPFRWNCLPEIAVIEWIEGRSQG
jgi:hypothetical protein